MKVLIVCSGNAGFISPFIKEQAEAIANHSLRVDYFTIVGKGLIGYLSNLNKLNNKIVEFEPDIIHAHYGLSGLLASFSKRYCPLITTFHGNDINPIIIDRKKNNFNMLLSKIASKRSDYSILVNLEFVDKISTLKFKYSVIPCHVDLDIFHEVDKQAARSQLGFFDETKYILFSSSFDVPIKNYSLAKKAFNYIENTKVIELKGYSRAEVNLLFNACDIALLTSLNEGSPQFIKEAMACNCPIVYTDVGDIRWVVGETEGCFLTSFEPDDVARKIKLAIDFSQKVGRTKGRKKIIELGLDSETITKRIIDIYEKVLQS
jgi:teichuronic acid biosynthesis glycosyltransferase TuaC